jgi:glycosyltransferase involved in cell wall biosynthesis
LKLSVVIPTYNRRDLIARTLPTVLGQDYPAGQYEVVVVVDGSTDGTADLLRSLRAPCSLRVLEQCNRGTAAARNAGIYASLGELVLILDDDIICEPTLVSRHIATHQAEGSGVVIGCSLVAAESRPGLATDIARDWYQNYYERVKLDGAPKSQYDLWVHSNFSAPRDLLLAHHAYDENLVNWIEDADLAIRLWGAGVRFRFEPEALVYQLYSKSAADLVLRDAPRMGAAELQLCRKEPGFKPHSRLASIVGHSRMRTLLAWLAAVAPISPEPMLRPMCWFAERFRNVPTIRRAGIALLSYRTGIVALRSAVRKAGSWRQLRREFDTRSSHAGSIHRSHAQGDT